MRLKKLFIYVGSLLLTQVSLSAEKIEAELTYLKEIKAKLSLEIYERPVHLLWSEVEEDPDGKSERWIGAMQAARFPLAKPNIDFDKWLSFHAPDTYDSNEKAHEIFTKTKELFPSPQVYKENSRNKSLADIYCVGEVSFKGEGGNGSHQLVVLYQSADDYKASPLKTGVRASIFIELEGKVLNSRLLPPSFDGTYLPLNDVQKLQALLNSGFVASDGSGGLVIVDVAEDSVLRTSFAER